MNPYAQKLVYKNIFDGVKAATGASAVILASDFDVIEFTLYVGFTATLASVSGTFVVGETVTGGTSSATGVIYAVTSTSIKLMNVTGTFQNAETITGGTSAATATISAVSTPNFTIAAYTSDQEPVAGVDTPPVPANAVSPSNKYTQVVYSDENQGVNYGVSTEFNPNTGSPTGTLSYTPKTFRFGTDGTPITGRWVFIKVLAFTGGALLDADLILSNI